VTDTKVPPDETIPTAELLDLIRKASEGLDWCSTAERVIEENLGIKFLGWRSSPCCCPTCTRNLGPAELRRDKRFTPADDAPTTVTKAAVTAMIRTARRDHPSQVRPVALLVGKKWGLDVAPAYRVRVTVMLDADELEEQGSGWPVGEDGKPTEVTDGDLLRAARYAVENVELDRVKVSVAR
jgi:hypothetical protein